MRDHVRNTVKNELFTLPKLASLLEASPVEMYQYVVTEGVCGHERIGKSLVVIDVEDIPIVKERLAKAKGFRANQKAKRKGII